MNEMVTIVLSNSLVAAAMLVAVLFAKRMAVRPQIIHVICVLILVKLVTPPLWQPGIALLPPAADQGVVAAGPGSTVPGTDTAVPVPMGVKTAAVIEPPESAIMTAGSGAIDVAGPSTVSHLVAAEVPESTRTTPDFSLTLVHWLMFGWLAGSLTWFVVSIRRIVRFRRCLRDGFDAGDTVVATAQRLADRLKLASIPRLRFVLGNASPMLWSLLGRANIILPTDLWARLESSERESLLLHELAHYRRGDHWVRLLEFVVTGLFWWNPVVWITRRELRSSEEECCDQVVVSTLPESKRAYAEAIVKTLGQVSHPAAVPGGTAMGWLRDMEKRLTKIMVESTHRPMSGVLKFALALSACLLLSMTPMLAQVPVDTEAIQAGDDLETDERAVVSVQDVDGVPVSGVKVIAFVQGKRADQPLTTDKEGRVRIPPEWIPSDPRDPSHAVLWIEDQRHGLGWKDLSQHAASQQVASQNGKSPTPPAITMLNDFRVIEGQYVDKTGRPIPQVAAVVRTLHSKENGHIRMQSLSGELPFGRVESDASGRFSLKLPAKLRYALRGEHRDWVRKELYQRDPENSLAEIELSPAGRIEGRVADANGNALQGHRIGAQAWHSEQLIEGSASWGSATTDEDGWYVIGGLPAGRFNVLYLGSEETPKLMAEATEGARVKVGASVQADFSVRQGTRVSGTVVDVTTGKKLTGIHVGYFGAARPDSGAAVLMRRSDAAGSFEFFVPQGLGYFYIAEGDRVSIPDSTRLLNVEDKDFGPFTLKAGPLAPTDGVEAAAETTASAATPSAPASNPDDYNVRIRLQPPVGKEVSSMIVRSVSMTHQRTTGWSSRSGESIEMEFSRRSGPIKFVIDAHGYQLAETDEIVVEKKNPVITVPLIEKVFAPIQGLVTDRDGMPIAGARVRVRRDIYRDIAFPFGQEYQTDEDGRFAVRHVGIGDRVQVRIDQEGTGGAESNWVQVKNDQPIRLNPLVLEPANKKLGGLIQDYDGFAVAGATVSLLQAPSVRGVSDAEGKFLLEGVPTGQQSLLVKYKQRRAVRRKGLADSLDNVIRIQSMSEEDRKHYTVDIQLKTKDGKPIERAHYFGCLEKGDYLVGMPDRTVGFEDWEFMSLRRRYPNQKLVVCVLAKGYKFAMSEPFEMKKDPPPVIIELEPADPVAVTGLVIDASGTPIAGARVGLSVQLTEGDNFEDWNYYNSNVELPETDAEGRYSIPNQNVGSRVAVYVKKPGYAGTWSQRVAVSSGRTELPTFELKPATMQVSGQVRDHKGQFVEGALVELLDLGPERTRTDKNGRFQIQGLGDRKFLMQVVCPEGYWNGTIRSGQTDRQIRLNRGR